MDQIHVAVAGASGKLGGVAAEAFSTAAAFDYVGGFARKGDPAGSIYSSLDALLERGADVLFDALTMPASFDATMSAVARGIRPVVGTSGWSAEQATTLSKALEEKGIGGMIVPNFSLGAMLMMRFSEEAAAFFQGVEIIEMHRATKKDKYKAAADRRAKSLMARQISGGGYSNYWRADDGTRPFFHASDGGLPVVSLLYYSEIADPGLKRQVLEIVKKSLEFELAITGEVNNPFGYSREYVKDKSGSKRMSETRRSV